MNKISLIIPHWPREPEHNELLKRCVKSFPPVYEKIIVYNEGLGMGWAINRGFELATGDYLMTCSNDCWYEGGDLNDMCDPEAVCIPDNLPGQWELPRCFYCIPRKLYDEVGGYDEQFAVGYFEDDDWIHRLALAQIPIKSKPVIGGHVPGQTLNNLPNRQEVFDKNKELFDAKWNLK